MRGTTACGENALAIIMEAWVASQNLRMDCATNDAHAGPFAKEKNRKFNAVTERFIARSMACSAVDAYHLYLQQLLALIVAHAPEVGTKISETKEFPTKIKTKPDSESILKANINASLLREFVHDAIDRRILERLGELHGDDATGFRTEEPETPLICRIRNLLSHCDGIDLKDEVKTELEKLGNRRTHLWPQMLPFEVIPVRFDVSRRLVVDFALGDFVALMIQHQIHQMDQCASFQFNLPTERSRPKSINRVIGHRSVPAGMSDESNNSELPTPAPTAPEKSRPEVTATSESRPLKSSPTRDAEIAFSKLRRELFHEMHEFVWAYGEEARIDFKEFNHSTPGRVYGHTIHGHDFGLDFAFNAPQHRFDEKPDRLGIRIRHENWQPVITVWGTNSTMEDFRTNQFTDSLKEKIRTCIDEVFRKSDQ